MNRFEFTTTGLAGLLVATRRPLEDARGFLSRLFCQESFAAAGMEGSVLQINHTLTRRRGSVRGLHFQHPPHAETKVVACLHGEVWDVAVDLRRGSSTFLRWHAERLSAGNQKSMLIPRGFAHGFQALADDCELLYLHTAAHSPAAEDGLQPEDPRLAIEWPLPVMELSERDRARALLGPGFEGLPT